MSNVFFFNDTATTEIYTLSLHDALPISLSTLLKTHGCEVKSHYLNLHFAHQLGLPIYNQLCEKRFLIGEWLFSHALFGDNARNQDYMNHFSPHIDDVCRSIERPKEYLVDVKTKMVPEFLQWSRDACDWGAFDVIGFSSTFNQNVASLTLADRKSTRLNSSHKPISYAVFCLKKKNMLIQRTTILHSH